MLAEVKKCAENHDIKGLRYIFVDALDVDPTFDTYRGDYNYCKTIPGMFDSHKDLTPMVQHKEGWTFGYWKQLKLDLMKNFSEKRFDHMIFVAKVVYSKKIARLTAERGKKNTESASTGIIEQSKEQTESAKGLNSRAVKRETGTVPLSVREDVSSQSNLEKQRIEAQKIEARKKALDAENKKIEAEQRTQRERIEAAKRAENAKQNSQSTGSESKKAPGIALAVIAAIMVVVLILVVLH